MLAWKLHRCSSRLYVPFREGSYANESVENLAIIQNSK